MEAGLMEIHVVRSVNRRWIYDSYFSLYRPIHPGGNARGKCPGRDCPNTEYTNIMKLLCSSGVSLYNRNSQANQKNQKHPISLAFVSLLVYGYDKSKTVIFSFKLSILLQRHYILTA